MLMGVRARRAASIAGTRLDSGVKKIGWPVLLLALAMLVQLVLSLIMIRGAWLTADPLYYITERGALPGSDEGLLASHRGHWLTVPFLLYRVLFPVFGLSHGWPYSLVSLLLHLSVVVLLFVLLRRASWGPGLAAVTVVPVVFLGAGAQAYISDHPLPLVLSLALGLAALLQFSTNTSRARVATGAGLLLLAVMSSGVGLVVLVTAGVWLWLRRGLLAAALGTAPAVLAFLTWFAVFGRDYDRVRLGGWDFLALPKLTWVGATTALERASGVPDSGALLLCLVIGAPLVLRSLPREARNLAWAGQVGAMVQLSLSAVGGGPEGYPPVTESRYAYVALVLLAPSVAVLLLAVRRAAPRVPRGGLPVLVGVLASAYLLNALDLQRHEADAFVSVSSGLRDRVVGTLAANEAGEEVLTARPDGLDERMNVDLVTSKRIAWTLPGKPASARQRIEAESEFFVGVSRDTFGLFAPNVAVSVSFEQPLLPGTACAPYRTVSDHPEIAVDTGGDGVEIAVKSPSTQVTTRLERGKQVSASRTWDIASGTPIHIATTAHDARLVVTFDRAGEYTICKH